MYVMCHNVKSAFFGLIVMVVFALTLQGQSYAVEHLSLEQGLSQSVV